MTRELCRHERQIETPDLSIAMYIDETPEGHPIYDDGYQKWVVMDGEIHLIDES
jgi:hypothetical protein